jgi:hypothetical protein
MKRRTIERIGLVIAAFLALFFVPTFLTGDSTERRDAAGVLIVLGSIGALFFAGWWFKVRPRREYHQAQARDLRLTSEPGDPLGFLNRGFVLLRRPAAVKDIENTSWGRWRDLDVAVFDFWLARSSDPSLNDYEYYTCVLTPVPVSWPRLSISPERLDTAIADVVGLRDVDFELEAFNRRFDVRTADRRFATTLVDARMMDWLSGLPRRSGFEILGGSLLCHVERSGSLDVLGALGTLSEFLDHVPPVVRSLYPADGSAAPGTPLPPPPG